MQLKYVELQGFKSFPDRTVINFGDGITAIVGPNGSGKSNIADAVRWVMGETSSKTLRGQKMEDVIFDGTAERKPLGFAEVTLVLDNSDRTIDIEYDELAITRRYYRSGESEYFINRSGVRLRDIQELLRDTGLGKTGYAIIGQGAITEIIRAKSSERRTLFEEAAGISNFRYKKEESERRLSQTQDNILRLNDIISELSARLVPLEAQAKKARKYLAMRDEKKNLEITLWTRRTEQLKTVLSEAAVKAEMFGRDSREATESLDKKEQEIIAITAEIEAVNGEADTLRAGIRLLEEEISHKQTDILVAENDIAHAEKDIERITADINDREGEQSKSDAELEAAKAELAAFDEKLLPLRERSETLTNRLCEITEIETKKYDTLALAQQNSDSLSEGLTSLRIRLGGLEQTELNTSKYIDERNHEIADADERMQSLKASEANAEKTLSDNRTRLAENANVLTGYEVKLRNQTIKSDKLSAELNGYRQSAQQKQDRLSILKGMEKHYEGFNNSVRTVMDESARGVLTGVEGTVSDLIRVSDEYAVAIETALGNALQNIVTASEKNAKSIIYFLKNRNAGRATFLPIDTVKAQSLRELDKIRKTDGFIGIASELIEFDGRYSGIFGNLLGKTVVAEDLDCAVKIAGGNDYGFKVVTLDGQTVNPGGSLTGGSVARNIGVLSRHNEIEALGAEVKSLNAKIAECEEKLKGITEEISFVKASMDGAEAEIRVLEQELVKNESDLAHYKEYIENVQKQKSLLIKELEEYSQNSEKIAIDRKRTSEEISETEKKIFDATKEKSGLQSEIDTTEKEKEAVKAEIHTVEMDMLELTKSRESTEGLIALLNERTEQRSQGRKKLEEEIAEFTKQIEKLRSDISGYAAEKAELEKEAAKTETSVTEKTGKRSELELLREKNRDEEKRLFTLREKLNAELDKQQNIIESGEAENSEIISKIWDEYSLTLSEAAGECIEIEDFEEARRKVNSIKASMRALGDVNPGAADEFAEVKERYENLSAQVDDLEKSKRKIESIIGELTGRMEEVFREKFEIINEQFGNVFREMFDGGTAKLTLEEPDNVLESGVEIFVAPPGKIIKHLSSLSGGEQALTAIALYFAIMKIRPAPFCLLDEIEAALDDVNVVRYADYLQRHSSTQFIVITHRRGTMESAHMLYGVTMKEKGISRVLAIDVSEIESHI